jgi:hypothetical protein
MDEMKWELLTEITGRGMAELFKSFLEAEGVQVQLIQESAGQSLFPVAVEGLGSVQVFVPKDQIEAARELLAAYEAGDER